MVVITNITRDDTCIVRDLKDTEESCDNDSPAIDTKDWSKTVESIEEDFCGLHGEKCPIRMHH